MATDLSFVPYEPEHRPVLERLWQLYRHDLSEFRGTHGPEGFVGSLPEPTGAFHTRTLDPFLEPDPDRAVHLFFRGEAPAGFAFVGRLTNGPTLMTEFFVVRGLRGRGAARAAADHLFRLYPGVWDIPFQERNVAAARFWRRLGGPSAHEELRPVPGKPDVPPDVWLTLTTVAHQRAS